MSDRRMSQIIEKRRAVILLSQIDAETSVESHLFSTFRKNVAMIFTNLHKSLERIARDGEVIGSWKECQNAIVYSS